MSLRNVYSCMLYTVQVHITLFLVLLLLLVTDKFHLFKVSVTLFVRLF